tara:strand:+ start:133 stop:411 length:279 start_codon:yes stop_codon:yes gene_type:complete
MTKDEIISEIEALRSIVAMGKDKLKEGQYLDMDMMQAKVENACEEVAELSPEDATEVRDPLNALLDGLKAYADSVASVSGEEAQGSNAEASG